jgi:hypothetical protein
LGISNIERIAILGQNSRENQTARSSLALCGEVGGAADFRASLISLFEAIYSLTSNTGRAGNAASFWADPGSSVGDAVEGEIWNQWKIANLT